MTAAFRLRVLPRVLPIDGREVGFQNDGTYVQWRYEATDTQAASDWTNLVALADITGPQGPNVELRNNGTSLQWRVEGDVSWNDLISIADMTAGATADAEGYAAEAAASAAAAEASATSIDPDTFVRKTDADVSANSWVIDEDDMASNSALKVPTQQSVKAYVDRLIVTPDQFSGPDFSAKLQAAVNYVAALSTGGAIFIPPGTFTPTTQVDFPKLTNKNCFLFGVGPASRIDVSGVISPSTGAAAFYVGSGTAAGGSGWRFEQIGFIGSGTTAGKAFEFENANITTLSKVVFETMLTPLTMSDSYSVTVEECDFNEIGSVGVYSSTAAHNLVVRRCHAFGVGSGVAGGRFLTIDGATFNIVIEDNDIESCRQVYSFVAGVSSLLVTGNYIEYCEVDPFDHGTGSTGVQIENNWIALGQAATGGDVVSIDNMTGGTFKHNSIYNQTISFGSTSIDVEFGDNTVTGTGTVTPPGWNAPSAYSNSWASDATYPVGYKKLSDGTVMLRGKLTSGTMSNVAFALPAGYRPLQRAYCAGLGDGAVTALVIVDTNGNVVPTAASGTNVYLDGIRFPIV